MFQNLFNYDNAIWRFIGKVGDMIILNILWIICSIPIVTIGASTTALYYCTLKIVRDEENGNIRMFFKSLKENLLQSTIIWVIMLAAGIVLSFDYYFFTRVFLAANQTLRFLAVAFTSAVFVIWFIVLLYIFPIQSRFVNPVKRTFMNAFFMSIRHLGRTILMVLMDVGIFVIGVYSFFYMPQIAGVFLLLGFPLIAWANSYQFEKIFQKYMPEEEIYQKPEEGYLKPILEDTPYKDGQRKAEEQAVQQSETAEDEEETPGASAGAETGSAGAAEEPKEIEL